MSFIQNFFTSRDNNANAATYIGQQDRLWYNPITQTLYVSDGVTPGGIPVNLATGANITANVITVNTLTSGSGNIAVTANLIITGNISPATDVKIGGVRAGPGANIANDGTLTIDTTGLPLSFGNFTANNNILSIVNVDENMILDTQGNAEIQLVGNIGFYKSNGGGAPDPADRYFQATEDGQLSIFVPDTDIFGGAIEIIGSTTGNTIAPGQPGAMLHITGQLAYPTRIYWDGNDDYVSLVARRWNGNVNAPTQVLAGDDVLRINATAATDLGGGNVGNAAMAQIRMTALENQTVTAQGSEIVFTVTPVGQPVANRVDVATITAANGVTATRFTTSGTVSATGNVTGGNIIGGNVLATGIVSSTGNAIHGNISTAGLVTATGNITGGNLVTAALVSARNYNGQARDAGTLGAAGTLTIDFATDHMVLVNLTTTATIAFANITAGKTVSVLVKNTTGQNRAVTLGVAGENTSGGNPAPNVNNNRTGVLVYRTFGTATTDVYCEFN
jgi:hypothetical protein